MNEHPETGAVAIDDSASLLGLDEFSLLWRIQSGDIQSARARWGEVVVPRDELEQFSQSPVNAHTSPARQTQASLWDSRLGIEHALAGLKRNGKRTEFTVPGSDLRFTANEADSYRAAFGAIANGIESAINLKGQLNGCVPIAVVPETEIHSPHIGKWRVRATLLNLGQSDILLCQQGEANFAVIERFRHDSPYAKAKGGTEILLQETDAGKLAGGFKVNAQHTLEFMVSNLVAKAQKVVWEQFPDHRPAKVVGAISDRCRTAIANEETVVEQRRLGQTIGYGMRI